MKFLAWFFSAFGLAALAIFVWTPSPPRDAGDLCRIFEEHRGWHRAAKRAEERWGLPVHVAMAFIHQESSFRAHARPPRQYLFGVIPGPRPSTALGYAQAVNGTWEQYKRATGHSSARRTDFADAVDFIGWYNQHSQRASGIARDDVFRLYLAYHEGNGGYGAGSWESKPWLIDVSRRVEANAERYRMQYERCRGDG